MLLDNCFVFRDNRIYTGVNQKENFIMQLKNLIHKTASLYLTIYANFCSYFINIKMLKSILPRILSLNAAVRSMSNQAVPNVNKAINLVFSRKF